MSEDDLPEVAGTSPKPEDPALMPPETDQGPIPNPGLPEHHPRPTDVDPKAERRAERQIAVMFILAALLSLGFCFAYFLVPADATFVGWNGLAVALGSTLGLGTLLIGLATIQLARKLMSDREVVEYRHSAGSTQEDRQVAVQAVTEGIHDSGIGRRPLIRNSMLAALGMLGLPAIVALRDLGPLPKEHLEHTVWRKGMRLVNDVAGTPIKPSDLQIGQLVNGAPEVFFETDEEGNPLYEGAELHNAEAKASVIIVRMQPEVIHPPKGHENWGVEGILCFSKICTHVGCPISLWESNTHKVLCPCHQSTFELDHGARVIFGPAARPLPQLPIGVDDEGYLIAMSDFHAPPGPSYWWRNNYRD